MKVLQSVISHRVVSQPIQKVGVVQFTFQQLVEEFREGKQNKAKQKKKKKTP